MRIGKNVRSVINVLQGKPDINVEIGGVGGTFHLGEHFEFPAGSTGRAFSIGLSVTGVTFIVQQDALRISAAHGLTPGPVTFTVTASASGLPKAFKVLRVNLIEAPDQPPRSVCAPTVQKTVDPGQQATFDLNACFKDEKPEELTFAVSRVVESSGTGWRRDISSGVLTIHSLDSMSSRDFLTLDVTATDSGGQSAGQAFRVNLNRAPHPVATQFLSLDLGAGGSETIDLASYFRDPEGTRLTFAIGAAPSGVTLQLSGSSLTVSADSNASGAYRFQVTVTTADGRSKTFDFQANVKAGLVALKDLVIRVMAGKTATVRLADFIGFSQGVTDPPQLYFVLVSGTHANLLRAGMDAAAENLTLAPPSDLEGEYSLRVQAIVVDARFAPTDFTFRVVVEDEEEELGSEWIRAQNVDCHVHMDTLIHLGIWGAAEYSPFSYSGGCRERKAHGRGVAVRIVSSANVGSAANVRYEGDWKEGRASGQGTHTVWDAVLYEGELLDGLRHGQGTETDGDHRYEGQWRHGRRHGRGTATYAGVWRYEGEWQDNVSHGQGTQIYYRRHSYGLIGWLPAGSRYSGGWREGYQHGIGTLTSPDGYSYQGGWRGGVRHGQGTETHPNGSHYVGEWEGGSFWTGQVTIIEDNGDRFEGSYRDGRRHGQGTETWANGGGREGEWRNGSFWNGIVSYPDGRTRTYSNGKCTRSTKSDGSDSTIYHEDGTTSCHVGSIQ